MRAWKMAVLLVAVAAALAEGDSNEGSLSIGGRVGYYGFPNFVLDEVMETHPDLSGSISGAFVGYSPGPNLTFSLAVDKVAVDAEGNWQVEPEDSIEYGKVEMEFLSFALTIIGRIAPQNKVVPCVGIGIGMASIDGEAEYTEAGITLKKSVSESIPVLHILAGIDFHITESLILGAEARFVDGFVYGGVLKYSF